jgi:hypothetical protein
VWGQGLAVAFADGDGAVLTGALIDTEPHRLYGLLGAISQARADADQKLKMAEQAVQIAENRAQAEASPLLELGKTLAAMHAEGGKDALDSYLRNASLPLREKSSQTILKI